MPNGGYPISFLAPVGDAGLALLVHGRHVQLVQITEAVDEDNDAPTRRSEVIGEFSTDQICALLHHLQYWGGGSRQRNGREVKTFDDQVIGARYRVAGCHYDY